MTKIWIFSLSSTESWFWIRRQGLQHYHKTVSRKYLPQKARKLPKTMSATLKEIATLSKKKKKRREFLKIERNSRMKIRGKLTCKTQKLLRKCPRNEKSPKVSIWRKFRHQIITEERYHLESVLTWNSREQMDFLTKIGL